MAGSESSLPLTLGSVMKPMEQDYQRMTVGGQHLSYPLRYTYVERLDHQGYH